MDGVFDLKFKKLEVVKSTNDFLRELIKHEIVSNGTFVFADFQDNGKGQREKGWYSDAGENLLFTMYLEPLLSDIVHLNYLVCTTVQSFVQKMLPNENVEIKWPNDVLVNANKIAGILIENSFSGSKIKNSIIGIGLNVNQLIFPQFNRPACSLSSLLGVKFDVDTIAKNLAQVLFEANQNKISKNNLERKYIKSLYLKNKSALFEIDNKNVTLTVFGVDPTGQLLAIDQHGVLRSFRNGSLKYLI